MILEGNIMKNLVRTLVVPIANVNIYKSDSYDLLSELTILNDGDVWTFGNKVFKHLSGGTVSQKMAEFFTRRCMQVTNATNIHELIGFQIRIKVIDGQILGISSLDGNEWFFPLVEYHLELT